MSINVYMYRLSMTVVMPLQFSLSLFEWPCGIVSFLQEMPNKYPQLMAPLIAQVDKPGNL